MAMGLAQHFNFPTHNSANTLDLFIMEIISLIMVVKCITCTLILDHAVVKCYPSLKKEDMLRKVISLRNMKSIDFDTFVPDMDLDEITGDNLDTMVEALKTKMSMSPDIHAPVTTKQTTIFTSNPQYIEEPRE